MSNDICQECGAATGRGEFHPYLYCELVQLGRADPEAYLRDYGFHRIPDPKDANG